MINAKRLSRADTSAFATVLAIVLALVATAAVYLYLQGVKERSTGVTEKTSLIVAKSDIPAGSDLGDLVAEGAFTTISVPTDLVVPGAITDLAQLDAKETADAILAGEQIPVARLEGTVPGGSLGIPKGFEAISIPIDANRVAGGDIRAGDRLTIYGTFGGLASDGGPATTILVPAAEILKVAGTSGLANGSGELTLTFALKGKDAAKLVYAQEQGSIWMALLAPNAQPPSRGLTGLPQVRP